MTNFHSFRPGELWPDDHGVHINAHGGCLLRHGGKIYWYGEHKVEGRRGNLARVGVHVYVSDDYYNWRDAGIAFDVKNSGSTAVRPGCVIERPKVLFCPRTGKFVMYFHFERDSSYQDASIGIATADAPEGPFQLREITKINPGFWPENTPPELRDPARIAASAAKLNRISCGENPEAARGSILGACVPTGQDSRDMTLFVDDDGRAYLIYSSERNSTTHVAELTDDYLGRTGRFWRIFPFRWMEAPSLFKHNGKYYFLGSGCTGWAPHAARSAVADSLQGPWTELGNPAVDDGGELTYGAQSTWIEPLGGGRFLFMADIWRPDNAIDGRYLWLPVEFEGERPVLRAPREWSLESL